ncbi:FAD-dependent oxidoreductase [Clostridium fermenticellae]|uniref:FAD-dependent oxidoreductase n=1 Tax=Clostridium fermenticellae TaxID=2068654 RepID=A0A386H093_9CLOT|nr:FAD-dependent oxidoreductase [Clostridium fermenticellae]AYD39058.1 FAD-dependent oxidoreductase [Clostridium fermenticellae]
MDYDVLILGGGIIGCAAAYELSKYSLNIALIERDYDIADDVALFNSTIVYDGLECNDSLMSKLEIMGNSLIRDMAQKFNVKLKEYNSMIIAEDENCQNKLIEIYNEKKDIIDNIYLLDGNDALKIEHALSNKVKKVLYSKNTLIIEPYDLALAYGEIAFDNGVNFKLEEEVLDIQRMSKGFRVITNKNKFTCNMVLNTTPGKNYSIGKSDRLNKNRENQKYFLLNNKVKKKFDSIITFIKEDGEQICMSPTIEGNSAVYIKSAFDISYEDAFNEIIKFNNLVKEENISQFYEIPFYNDTLIIDDSFMESGYISVNGKSYAQVTITPAIAKIVCETIVNNLNCVLKKDFIDKRREFYKFRDLCNNDRKKIIKLNKSYGKMVCYCNKITEGEIIDAIRRPLGARTLEGVRRRTGITFGDCMGARCLNKVIKILAREMNKDMTDIVRESGDSKLILGRIKEFNDM